MPFNISPFLAQEDELKNFFDAAAAGNNAAVMAYLNKHGLDAIDRQDNNGWTALMHASITNHVETIGLLIENGASLEIESKSGNTPAKLLRIYADTNTIVDLQKFIAERHMRIERRSQEEQKKKKQSDIADERTKILKKIALKPILKR